MAPIMYINFWFRLSLTWIYYEQQRERGKKPFDYVFWNRVNDTTKCNSRVASFQTRSSCSLCVYSLRYMNTLISAHKQAIYNNHFYLTIAPETVLTSFIYLLKIDARISHDECSCSCIFDTNEKHAHYGH